MSIGLSKRWRILERDGFTCRYCGASAPYARLQVDHVVARSTGGSDHPSNLVTSCFDCNQGKKARDGSVGLSVSHRLMDAKSDADVMDFWLTDAKEDAAYWQNEARRLRERLVEYEVLAEDHGWFEE